MLLESLRALLRNPGRSRTSRDWNAQRQVSLRSAEDSRDEHERIRAALSRMHWLSLVCFLEETDPQPLLLTPELLTRLTDELTQLRSFDPLQVTACVLEQLSQDEVIEDCSEEDDAEAA